MAVATAGAAETKGPRSPAQPNVGRAERTVSMLAGGALATYGLRRRGAPGIALALLGAELLRRGASGHCRLYETFGLTSAGEGVGALPHRSDVTSRAATVNARKAVKFERRVTVRRPAFELYVLWRDFSNLPRFLKHLESVECRDDRRSHWVVRLDSGERVEWDAEIVNDIHGELIAWKTVGNPDIAHAGSVHFRPLAGARGTEVRLVLDYEPPEARVIAAAAKRLGHGPHSLLGDELLRFKELVETGEFYAVDGQREGEDAGSA